MTLGGRRYKESRQGDGKVEERKAWQPVWREEEKRTRGKKGSERVQEMSGGNMREERR